MRKSSKNPGGVPDFLYCNPVLFDAVDCAKAKPALFENWLQTAFPESECDLENLFDSQKDEPAASCYIELCESVFNYSR